MTVMAFRVFCCCLKWHFRHVILIWSREAPRVWHRLIRKRVSLLAERRFALLTNSVIRDRIVRALKEEPWFPGVLCERYSHENHNRAGHSMKQEATHQDSFTSLFHGHSPLIKNLAFLVGSSASDWLAFESLLRVPGQIARFYSISRFSYV